MNKFKQILFEIIMTILHIFALFIFFCVFVAFPVFCIETGNIFLIILAMSIICSIALRIIRGGK